MSERIRPSKRPGSKPNHKRGQPSKYLPLWIFGGTLIIVAIIIGALVFTPPTPKTDPLEKSQGPQDAKVVVTEYGDFQCPACKIFALEISPKIKADYVDKGLVRFAFRQMAFIGPESRWAAEASECANDQGRFWDYYEKTYQEQGGENVGDFSKENLIRFAEDLKLDMSKFTPCLNSGKYQRKVENETSDGDKKGITSTPSVTVNGELVVWNGNYDMLKAVIDKAIQDAN